VLLISIAMFAGLVATWVVAPERPVAEKSI
jgi:hypothetical protein